jgi:diguanylate cyclase (GGDEF)-like protein
MIRSKILPASPRLKDIVIVGVDDDSFSAMNRAWPWGRDIFAFFLEKLDSHQPRVIGFDFVFNGLGSDPKADAWLAQAIQSSGRVILAGYMGASNSLVQPHPIFMKGALSMGLIDKPQDADAVNRMARFNIREAHKIENYSLAIEGAYRYEGTDPEDFVRSEKGGGVTFISTGASAGTPSAVTAQTDLNHQMRISYRHKPSQFKYIPFWQVIKDQVPADFFKNKLVLVGVVSPIFHDVHQTPLGQMPGLFANANEVVAIWDRDFIWEPFKGRGAEFALLLGIIFTLLIYELSFGVQIAVYGVISLLFYAICVTLFCKFNILFEPFSALIVFLLNFSTVASWKALKTFLDNVALQRQVITDSLTGLYGHRFLTFKLGSIYLHSAQTKSEFCVAMLDADYFKKVNDNYGHDMGNQVLIGITKVMKQQVRRQDVAARFGGEEFAIIMVGTDTKGAREGLERIRVAIEELEFSSEKGKFKVTISAGLVSNQNPAVKNSEDMIKMADKALYEAKAQGRNRVCTA